MLDLFSRWQHRLLPVVLLLTLTLAGCYQPADDSFEPVAGGAAANVTATEPPLFTEATATDITGGAQIEATEIPADATAEATTEIVEDIEPTDEIPATEIAAATATDSEALLVFTVAPSSTPTATRTPMPTSVDVEPTDDAAAVAATDEGGGFLTPGSPPDPVVIATSTPDTSVQPTAQQPTTRPSVTESGPAGTPTATLEVDEECLYTVRPGDTLYRIAIANGVFLRDLRAANPEFANTDVIFPGQQLIIPGCEADEDGDSTGAAPTITATATETVEAGMTIHTVQAGETLVTIARRYSVTVQAIVNANPNLENPNRLSIGQRLNIPTGEADDGE